MLIDPLSSPELDHQEFEARNASASELWDDVFEIQTDGALSRDVNLEPSDVPRVQAAHSTAGYRDGIAVAKTEYMQAGFDEGYGLGGEVGHAVGWILGALEGLVATSSSRKRAHAPGESASAIQEDEKLAQARQRAKELLIRAKTELDAGKVFGKEYITEEGIWTWDTNEAESDTVFRDVALKHPLIVKWRREIDDLVKEFGIDLSIHA